MDVNVSDVITLTHYVKVLSVNGETVEVQDLDNGDKFVIRGKKILDRVRSADFVEKEDKKTSKTDVAVLLSSAFGRAFSVCFEKADGTERVMRCRLIKPEAIFGRSMVEDLDLPQTEHRQRQIDHRTIKWLVLDGVKYIPKK